MAERSAGPSARRSTSAAVARRSGVFAEGLQEGGVGLAVFVEAYCFEGLADLFHDRIVLGVGKVFEKRRGGVTGAGGDELPHRRDGQRGAGRTLDELQTLAGALTALCLVEVIGGLAQQRHGGGTVGHQLAGSLIAAGGVLVIELPDEGEDLLAVGPGHCPLVEERDKTGALGGQVGARQRDLVRGRTAPDGWGV
jgi:hypothetical protein